MEDGFIGLGAMGSAMARNLAKAGHKVRAWNRSGDSGIEGVEMASDPAYAFGAEAVFTMLSDDPAIRERRIGEIVGGIESGLFIGRASLALVAGAGGVAGGVGQADPGGLDV